MDHSSFAELPTVQATALAAVVELEAAWENIPVPPVGAPPGESLRGLTAKQRAFDAYHVGLVEYNRRYGTTYRGERPATTPGRLAGWCRKLANLYRRASGDACPAEVLDKVHRCADRLAARLAATMCPRPAAHANAADAVADLRSIADWCDGLAAPRIPS